MFHVEHNRERAHGGNCSTWNTPLAGPFWRQAHYGTGCEFSRTAVQISGSFPPFGPILGACGNHGTSAQKPLPLMGFGWAGPGWNPLLSTAGLCSPQCK